MKLLSRLLTKNFKRVPLISVTFNYKKFIQHGKEGSCNLSFHPELSNDEKLKNMFKEIVDYIRDNYDMEEIL